MSDQARDPGQDDQESPLELAPVLEAPPPGDAPMAGASGPMGLFEDDSIAVTAAKFALVESFLRSITRDQSYSDFMREILLAVMRVVQSEAGSIFEVDHARNALFFRSIVGASSDRLVGFVIPMGQGIVGHVAESRQPLVVANVSENRLHLRAIQEAVGFETRNLVAVPIVVRGRIHGVLELLNRIGESDYTASDVELLNYACEMAAKAIEARLMIAWGAQAMARQGSSSSSSSSGDAA